MNASSPPRPSKNNKGEAQWAEGTQRIRAIRKGPKSISIRREFMPISRESSMRDLNLIPTGFQSEGSGLKATGSEFKFCGADLELMDVDLGLMLMELQPEGACARPTTARDRLVIVY